MFGGRIALIKKIFSTFLDHHCCDDEGYIGKLPSLTRMDHVIDTHFTVVHYAFKLQYKTDKGKDHLVNYHQPHDISVSATTR